MQKLLVAAKFLRNGNVSIARLSRFLLKRPIRQSASRAVSLGNLSRSAAAGVSPNCPNCQTAPKAGTPICRRWHGSRARQSYCYYFAGPLRHSRPVPGCRRSTRIRRRSPRRLHPKPTLSLPRQKPCKLTTAVRQYAAGITPSFRAMRGSWKRQTSGRRSRATWATLAPRLFLLCLTFPSTRKWWCRRPVSTARAS